MNLEICLKKLQYVGVLNFATIGEDGAPQVRCISAIHYEPDAMYFFTARGKNFCRQLRRDGRVQVLAYTMYKEMIRLAGVAFEVSPTEQARWIDAIFTEQPYLANVYPDDTRKIGTIFCIRDACVEYFNLGVRPIFRETYAMGAEEVHPKGYCISDACIGCGICEGVCPQRAIVDEGPRKIMQEHCLHCGSCFEHCPAQAILRIDDCSGSAAFG
ncbi:MAG: 4Fe-4S binding protein [Clostridia bacterium]|nr:4Fe-4S binding protein [Clostridia bacterium]